MPPISAPQRVPVPPITTITSSVSVKLGVVTSVRRAAEQQQVDDAAGRREERREHERHQLVRVRAQPEHLDAQLVLADRLPDVARATS